MVGFGANLFVDNWFYEHTGFTLSVSPETGFYPGINPCFYPFKRQSNLLSSKHGYKMAQLYVTRFDNYGKAKLNRYQLVFNIEKLESILDIYLIFFV